MTDWKDDYPTNDEIDEIEKDLKKGDDLKCQ